MPTRLPPPTHPPLSAPTLLPLPAPIDLPLSIFRAGQRYASGRDESDPAMGWSRLTTRGVRTCLIPGGHGTILSEPHVAQFAAHLAGEIAVAVLQPSSSAPAHRAPRPVGPRAHGIAITRRL